MVQNRSKNPSCRTNLIVAPLALLNQWKQEIEDKTNYGLTCLVYHGQFMVIVIHNAVLNSVNVKGPRGREA